MDKFEMVDAAWKAIDEAVSQLRAASRAYYDAGARYEANRALEAAIRLEAVQIEILEKELGVVVPKIAS